MKDYSIKELLAKGKDALQEEVIVRGWVRSFRSNQFIALNDGSGQNNIQIIINYNNFDTETLKQITTASSLYVEGMVTESKGAGQDIEVVANVIKVYGFANPEEVQETILQPKKHSLEKLREQAHLRFRTNTFAAVKIGRAHV